MTSFFFFFFFFYFPSLSDLFFFLHNHTTNSCSVHITMTVNIDQFVVSAPGKVILFGEHAAVYNKPAIAAAIALRTYMLVVPSQGSDAANLVLEFPSINLRFSYPVADLPWDAVKPQNKAAGIDDLTAIPTELDEEVLKALEPLLKDLKNTFQHVAVLAFSTSICICVPPICPRARL